MTDHDWAPIAPPEDNAIMCNVCLQCKCCSEVTEGCTGEWIPEDEDGFWKGRTERSRERVRDWLERKRGTVKITESTKYVVKDRANHRSITNGASRTNAHAVRRHLGDRLYVFTRITKRESR